jgi:hypothetical protein
LRTPGQPLDAGSRAFMEPGFGRDLSGVRVHADSDSARASEALNARAFTFGSHIVFNSGEHATHAANPRLLAHELTHVIQQADGGRASLKVRGMELGFPSPIFLAARASAERWKKRRATPTARRRPMSRCRRNMATISLTHARPTKSRANAT